MAQIKYDDNYSFMGRNGVFKVKGLDIDSDYNYSGDYPKVTLYPITSRGTIASCYIEIPKNKIQELIDELQKLI